MQAPYARQPIDAGSNVLVGYPAARKAETQYYSQNASTSSVITMDDDTTVLEISATEGNGLLRWVPTTDTQASVTGSNFDHVLPRNQVRRFAVPQEGPAVASIVGANIQNGLYRRYAYITNGNASIIASEFR